MPTRRIQRGPATGGPPVGFQNSPAFNELYVDGLTDALMVGTGISGANAQPMVQSMMAAFIEDGVSLTYTATFPIPVGALLLDIGLVGVALWGATTAILTIGDAALANGWFIAANLKATDLLVGERLSAADSAKWGGLNGVYLVAATGKFGPVTGPAIAGIVTTPYNVIMVLNTTGPSNTGRTFGYVTYQLPAAVVPVKA